MLHDVLAEAGGALATFDVPLRIFHGGPEMPLRLRRRARQSRARFAGSRGNFLDHDIREGTFRGAAGLLQHEPRDEIVRQRRGVEVGAALKAMARIGMQAVPPRTGANRRGLKPGCLDQDVLRHLGHARVPPAHHAGQRECLALIGDHEVVGSQRVLAAVQQAQLLRGVRAADDDAALDRVQVEHMGRLAHGEPAEVRGVHGGRDRLLADRGEVLAQ